MPQNKPHTHYKPQKLQQQISAALLAPDQPYDGALEQEIIAGALGVKTRLSIYQDNVIGGLTDVLLTRFPTISLLVGEEFARAMARAYILQSPPHAANLNIYGADYPGFIASFPPAIDLPYLADMAQLENAEHEAYYAGEAEILSLKNAPHYLPKIESDEAALRLHPSARLVETVFPLTKLRAYAQGGDQEQDFNLDGGGEFILVWRYGFRVQLEALSEATYLFLSSIAEAAALPHALSVALDRDQNFNFNQLWDFMLGHEILSIQGVK